MTRRLMLIAFSALLVAPLPTLAHEGHDHKVLGTVTMAMADHVMVKEKDGKDVTVKVTKDTKVKGASELKVEQIKVGTRVAITATMAKDDSLTAKIIEVGSAVAK